MEHPFTWYALLPHDWQADLPQHTFFALVSALFVLLFAWRGRVALARAQILRFPLRSWEPEISPSSWLDWLSVKAMRSLAGKGANLFRFSVRFFSLSCLAT